MSVDATIATWKLGKHISAIQKLILLSLADRAGENGECWPSLQRLVLDTNLNIKTIKENRQSLIKMGLIIYTGEMKGARKQIPVMKLTYIQNRELFTEPENGLGQNFTEPENGLFTEPENGLLNLKEEPKNNTTTATAAKSEKQLSELIDIYHKILPDSPRILTPSDDLRKRVKQMVNRWSELNDEQLLFSPEGFANYLKYLRDHQPGFLKPYETKSGNTARNNLDNLIVFNTMAKFRNGQFNFLK